MLQEMHHLGFKTMIASVTGRLSICGVQHCFPSALILEHISNKFWLNQLAFEVFAGSKNSIGQQIQW